MKYTVFIILFFFSQSLWSDDKHLLDILIDSTLKHHPSVKSAQLAIQGAEVGIESAKWGYWPTPSVSVDNSEGRRSTLFQLSQPLWSGGKLDAVVDKATAYKSESNADLEQSRYDLAFKCIELYATLIQTQGRICALDESINRLLRYDTMIRQRVEGGVSPSSDRELISNRISQTRNERLNQSTAQRTALSQLHLLSGMDIQSSMIDNNYLTHIKISSIQSLIDNAYATYPIFKKQRAQIEAARYELDNAKAQLSPNLSAKVERQIGSIYQDSYSDNRFILSVSMNTGAGLSSLSNIQSAQLKIDQLLQNVETSKIELAQKIESDYDNYGLLDERITIADQSIHSSEEVLNSYTRLFIAGKRSWLDVVNAARELTDNQKLKSDMVASSVISGERLKLYQGKTIMTPSTSENK
ncbi:MAG: TolC family protein [Sulfuricurvum sp.]|uniref:TolC family protein n=1 Tax=Sulfuricurvum sp. TaxID=2025608 RepID=UPI00262EE61B|nr:TolC family protein [Sulfuricurvum sp.]MDD2830063.1 TolC family protein [Sulfuricurvum sp.]MDD4950629.1 TolC family protein [Sulfuricurvum sp.]